ncbi:hypothetical protein VCRA2128O305_170097 [Vibrio crassostreae]|nr:hypothetical protein VCRA2116O27_140024 [Vibrio crassostreae]CAK1770470.1 hypothetical protein VCRA2118O41_150021 [Vibrio crassostreae]CAK1770783.1 hypothetical protein VCRA2116O233_150095 [Vibrio crassostreae]CAK1771636.1 hypothetical protein VCRA2116O28_140135 [Vibrio crassostreae]CAK1772680.1 hypothetical protein VCRA2117O38_150026 [Vibrio crassostreae]
MLLRVNSEYEYQHTTLTFPITLLSILRLLKDTFCCVTNIFLG